MNHTLGTHMALELWVLHANQLFILMNFLVFNLTSAIQQVTAIFVSWPNFRLGNISGIGSTNATVMSKPALAKVLSQV